MRRRLRRSCAQMTACKIRQMVPLSGRILRSPASSRVFDSASALRPDLRLPRQGPLGSRSGEATGCHQSMWAGPGSSAQAVRKLSPSAGSTLADRGVLDGWPLPQSLVGRVRDGLRPSGRRGSDQCLYLWRVSEADHRRSRAEPWGVFCGSDGSRDDRRDCPSGHRLAGRSLGCPADHAARPVALRAGHRVLRVAAGLAAAVELSDLRADRLSRRSSVADPLRRGDRPVVRPRTRPGSWHRHGRRRPWRGAGATGRSPADRCRRLAPGLCGTGHRRPGGRVSAGRVVPT